MNFLCYVHTVVIPHGPNPELEVVPYLRVSSQILSLLARENSAQATATRPGLGIAKALEIATEVVRAAPDMLMGF